VIGKIHLDAADRQIMETILGRGLGDKRDLWRPARLALARSLQMPDPPSPEQYPPLAQQGGLGVELHAAQFTGEGKDELEDYTDLFRGLLSAYHGADLTSSDALLHDCLQRHVRRGLKYFREHWDSGHIDFSEFLLREMFADTVVPEATPVTSAALASQVEEILGQLGVGGTVIDTEDGPRLTRYTLELHELDDLDRLRRGLNKIAFALGYGETAVTASMGPGERRLYLSVPRPADSWQILTWKDVSGVLRSDRAGGMALPICIGADAMGAPFLLDLAEAPHLFLGGTTGSGKSMCLHSILLSLLSGQSAPPELVLIDPKAVEFAAYSRSPHIRAPGIVTNVDEALAVLNGLVAEMEARQLRLQALDARNIDEANELGANLKRVVVIVDELGDLFMTNRQVEVPLIRLAQKARSSGIHLVLATQRPEAATFPGLLRSNIPSRIALTVQKGAESRIILDEQGAEALQGRGDMLVKFAGKQAIRAHGSRVDPADIAAAVRRV
jgi:S-DNA-T family DNA segregation ATPase FtsK/SpoIIIE